MLEVEAKLPKTLSAGFDADLLDSGGTALMYRLPPAAAPEAFRIVSFFSIEEYLLLDRRSGPERKLDEFIGQPFFWHPGWVTPADPAGIHAVRDVVVIVIGQRGSHAWRDHRQRAGGDIDAPIVGIVDAIAILSPAGAAWLRWIGVTPLG